MTASIIQAGGLIAVAAISAYSAKKSAEATAKLEQLRGHVETLKIEINHKMDDLLSLTRKSSFAEGKLAGQSDPTPLDRP
jgi:hypothetical protein